MTIKELLEKYGDIDITEEKEKELKNLLNIKDNKKWKPKYNENYWFVNDGGDVKRDIWSDHCFDMFRYNCNNCFKTEKEAEFRAEQIKVYNELKNFADENNNEIDWKNNSKDKYYIYYDYSNHKLDIKSYVYCRDLGQIYFSSKELVKKAIKKVGDGKIKKYLFGIDNEEKD